MPSFKKCCDIEEQGMRRLSQFFQANSATGYVTTGKGRMSRELQLTKGDVFLNNKAVDDGQMTLIGASQGNFWEHGR